MKSSNEYLYFYVTFMDVFIYSFPMKKPRNLNIWNLYLKIVLTKHFFAFMRIIT